MFVSFREVIHPCFGDPFAFHLITRRGAKSSQQFFKHKPWKHWCKLLANRFVCCQIWAINSINKNENSAILDSSGGETNWCMLQPCHEIHFCSVMQSSWKNTRWFKPWPFDPQVGDHLTFEGVTDQPPKKVTKNCQVPSFSSKLDDKNIRRETSMTVKWIGLSINKNVVWMIFN